MNSSQSLAAQSSVVIMDIEGTVAPIEFVHQKMFPYVRDNVKVFLESTWDTEQTQADIQLLIQQSAEDKANDFSGITLITGDIRTPKEELLPQLVVNVTSQMDIDRKIGALKTLQGHIWKQAFTSGELVAELFTDVHPALEKWSSAGDNNKILAIYSSGSVGAQQLLFSHTRQGDLTPLFKGGFYDTTVGHKREAQSYRNIAETLKLSPSVMIFLTDIYEEAVAAKEAGMNPILVLRPGNYPLIDDHGFPTISSFLELF